MAALAGFLTGSQGGDGVAVVTVTEDSSADVYLKALPAPAGQYNEWNDHTLDEFGNWLFPQTNGEEWAYIPVDARNGTTAGWRVGPSAYKTLKGAPAPPAPKSTQRYDGGGLIGC